MAQRDFKLGAFSSVLAALMVVALSIMAFAALQPTRDPPLRSAHLEIPIDIPDPSSPMPNA